MHDENLCAAHPAVCSGGGGHRSAAGVSGPWAAGVSGLAGNDPSAAEDLCVQRNCGCHGGNSGGACPWRSAHPGRMDGRLCMGHGAGRHRSYPVELRFAGRAEPCLYHRRSGGVCPLVSGRLSSVLLGRGLWPVRHRACQREFVEIQHLHLAGVHPEPCQNHSAGVWAAVAAGSDLLFSAQLAGGQAAGNGGFRAGCAGRGADRTAAYGGLCRGTGRKAEPDQCAAANAERTAGPAGRCPHPVDRRGQPRCAHPAGADPGLGGAAGAGRRPAGNCPAKGRRHPHPERKTPHPN